jgi:hypothetical protein
MRQTLDQLLKLHTMRSWSLLPESHQSTERCHDSPITSFRTKKEIAAAVCAN